jgi:hypothetical protein
VFLKNNNYILLFSKVLLFTIIASFKNPKYDKNYKNPHTYKSAIIFLGSPGIISIFYPLDLKGMGYHGPKAQLMFFFN